MFRNLFTLQEKVIAVVEQVLINVNLKLRKSEPYPHGLLKNFSN